MGDDQGGPVHGGDHVGHREGLPGAGHPEEDLVVVPLLQPRDEPGDRLRLIPPRLKLADQMKRAHAPSLPGRHPVTIPRG